MVNTSQFEAKPDEVDHWTPSSHWCAGCWHWVVDCEHVLLEPLASAHHAVDDGWIQSLAYDRVTQCLEVRFKWHSVHQYRPVPLQVVRKIWKARPMNTALQERMKNRRIRFDEVRSWKTARIVATGLGDGRAVVNPYSRFTMWICGASKIDTDSRDIEKVQ